MDVHKGIERIGINRIAISTLLIIAGLYVFLSYSSWLTSSCIAPVGADIKFHVSTVRSFVDQIKNYGFIYPVDYLEDVSGFFWYIRGLIPLIAPALTTIFLPFNAAFYFTYLLLYIAVVLAFYTLIKNMTDVRTGFLSALFFLFSNLSNMIFSVGGNYQFFFGLVFFFLAMKYLFLYDKSETKKDLILLLISALALGMTYIFSLIFFLSFTGFYGLLKKKWVLLKLAVLITLALGLFIVPLAITGSSLSISGEFFSLGKLLKTYILPSSPWSWIYQSQTRYQGNLDFNQGIHVYLAGIVALCYIFYKKIKDRTSIFLLTYLATMIIWVILGILSRLSLFHFMGSFFASSLPLERLMMHVALAFVLLAAYTVHKLETNIQSFITVLFFGLMVLGLSFFTNKLFFMLCGIAIVYGIHEWMQKKAITARNLIISSLILLLLLFPLTGKVETTNLEPRSSFFIIDNIKQHLAQGDVFYFVGGWSVEQTIMSCTGTSSIVQIDRDTALSGLSGEMDIFDPSEKTKEKLEQRGVTKIIVFLEKILNEDGSINEKKVMHLVNWFGNPLAIETFSSIRGEKKPYDPLLLFNVPSVKRLYTMEKIKPTKIKVTNDVQSNKLLLNLEYHPWWRAKDQAGNSIKIQNSEGLMNLQNVGGIREIILTFSYFYFIVGFIVSLVGFFLLAREMKRHKKNHKQ